jgi:hypothetical protein
MRQVKIIFLLCSKEPNPFFQLDPTKAGLSNNGKKADVQSKHKSSGRNNASLWGKETAYTYEVGDFQFIKVSYFF